MVNTAPIRKRFPMASVSKSLKDRIRKRASNCCEKCGTRIVRSKSGSHNGSIHHRKPQRLGGKDTLSNCVLVCMDCHRDIHRNELAASLLGWIVWSDPDVCPVLRATRRATTGWVLLVPDGGLEYLSHPEGERLCLFVSSGLNAYLQGA